MVGILVYIYILAIDSIADQYTVLSFFIAVSFKFDVTLPVYKLVPVVV